MASSHLADVTPSDRERQFILACRADWEQWVASNPPENVDGSWWSVRDAREERQRRAKRIVSVVWGVCQ